MSTWQRLFDEARRMTPSHCVQGFEWLERLEMDGAEPVNSWVYSLKGYVGGLWGMDAITVEDFDGFNRLLIDSGFI